MASVQEIRSKIGSVQNTQKITKAMKMVAASKMRKSQELMASTRPYTEAILQVISRLTLGNLEYQHPYLSKRDVKRIAYVVVSTDRGLCGGLNANLFKKLLLEMKGWSEESVEIDLAVIGAKALAFFGALKGNMIAEVTGVGDKPSLLELTRIVKVLLHAYDDGDIDKLYIISNKFVNTMIQEPRSIQLLPLPPIHEVGLKKTTWDYLYESDPKEMLDALLHRYIELQVYQGIVENLASEQAARMVAMRSATDNGGALLTELQLVYNKARQASITQELNEIVSGASVV